MSNTGAASMTGVNGAALATWFLFAGAGALLVIGPNDVETQRGTTAAGTSAEIATPAAAVPWTAEISSEGAAVLVVDCDGAEVRITAPGSVHVEDSPAATCSASVQAPGPRVAQWAVTTRLEVTK